MRMGDLLGIIFIFLIAIFGYAGIEEIKNQRSEQIAKKQAQNEQFMFLNNCASIENWKFKAENEQDKKELQEILDKECNG